ncbi:MarR family transcriptional regulator [Clostridium autoethanogenum]|uniref:HTH marR-type domain-containing protein n=3 Tax=Clostridium TaxID=1485 RepID=A0A1A6ATF7_9CLOT|nr:MarR family transcriptional regulator [Clostridium ragsdalei]OBR93315.1 hypothetical protein CLRAG_20510 [Clostridium ragsdalei P11]RMC99827.1 MarR family transcriptional regulator [Clostridium autoethanogenum]
MHIYNRNMIDDIFNALEVAKKAHDLLPPLPPNIKPVHFRILSTINSICDDAGNSRVTDINKALDFLLPNTTKFINELVKLKVVEKFTSTIDKRVVLVHATKLGKQYIDSYIIKYQELLHQEFSTLDESDCRAMIETIHKVYGAIKKVYQK